MIIKLSYKGRDYTINEAEVFDVCDQIEAHVALGELAEMLESPRKIRFAKLARAYAAMLQAVGAPQADVGEIHQGFRGAMASGDATGSISEARGAIVNLMAVLMGDAPAGGDKEPGNVGS